MKIKASIPNSSVIREAHAALIAKGLDEVRHGPMQKKKKEYSVTSSRKNDFDIGKVYSQTPG